MFLRNINYKNLIILSLFSLSIFFSHLKIYDLEVRFIYLFILFFFIYDLINLKKINYKLLIILFFIIFFLFIHSYFNQVNFFNDLYKVTDDISNAYNNYYKLNSFVFFKKLILKCLLIFFTCILVYYYKDLLVNNIFFICNFYIFSLFLLISFFSIGKLNYILDTFSLFNCNYGFFRTNDFLYTESSFFNLISIPIIIFFSFKLKEYYKYKIIFVANILFLIFSFLNFSLTFYLALNLSIISIFIFIRNLTKLNFIGLLFLLIVSNLIFFIEGKSNYCPVNETEIISKYDISKDTNVITGGKMSAKAKLFKYGITAKERNHINLSTSIYLYSLHLSYENFKIRPFGIGLSNYELAFHEEAGKNLSPLTFVEENAPLLDTDKFLFLNRHVLKFNRQDGSINFSKIFVEYGLIALALSIYLIIQFFRLKNNYEFKIFVICFLIPQIFVRGSGLFYNGFLIILILLIIQITNNKNENY